MSYVRFVGAALYLCGMAGTFYSTWAMYHRKRPHDVVHAVAAPVALLAAVSGLILAFVPGFFG